MSWLNRVKKYELKKGGWVKFRWNEVRSAMLNEYGNTVIRLYDDTKIIYILKGDRTKEK